MKEVVSNIANLANRAREMFQKSSDTIDCDSAQDLMSPFIDSMTSVQEAEQLEQHLSSCEPCRRQLQSFISVRNCLTSSDGSRRGRCRRRGGRDSDT